MTVQQTPPGWRPILFSGAMVRAILEGRKTVTRRLITQGVVYEGRDWDPWPYHVVRGERGDPVRCPYGTPGTRLWVRETFGIGYDTGQGGYSAIPWSGSTPERDGKGSARLHHCSNEGCEDCHGN